MTDLLNKWLNVNEGGRIAPGSLWVTLARLWPIWALLIALAAIALGAWWAYRPTPSGALEPPRPGGPPGRGLPRGKRWAMAILRVGALLLLLAVLLEPRADYLQTQGVKPVLVVLLDDSQSMTIRDRRLTAADKLQAAKALGVAKYAANGPGGGQPGSVEVEDQTRAELLKAAWQNKELDLQRRLGEKYRLRFYRFSKEVQEIGSGGKTVPDPTVGMTFDGGVTDLSGAIHRAVDDLRGKSAAGVVVFSDGAWNRGEPPAETVTVKSVSGKDGRTIVQRVDLPVFTVGLGLVEARDLAMASFLSDDVVFINDTIRVDGKVAQRGYPGETVSVELRRENEVLARKAITLTGEPEQSFQLTFVPKVKGEANYTLAVEQRPDELIPDNNARQKRIKVIDEAIKVLIAEEAPRWDYRFLKGSLTRDKRVQLRVWVREADGQELSAAGMAEYLPRFPDKREDLFKYDVIILGDVPADAFSKAQLKLLEEFVAINGGGLMFAAGVRYNPSTYAKTVLEPLVPVAFQRQPPPTPEMELFAPLVQPYHVEITREGMASPVCALADNEAANASIWRRLPPFFWHVPDTRLRSGAAMALAVVAESKVKDGQKTPLIAHQYYGRGMTFYLGTDSTWRWRDRVGSKHFDRFWGQTIDFLSMAHLLGESRRIQIDLPGKLYSVGDAVPITARVLDKSYQPLKAATIAARIMPPPAAGAAPTDAAGVEVVLRASPDRQGTFTGAYLPAVVGDYTVTVKGEEEGPSSPGSSGQPEGKATFHVQVPRLEFDRPTMDEETLRAVAAVSGGQFFELGNLDQLPDAIANSRPQVTVGGHSSIWDSWPMLIAVVLLLGLELLIRKRSDLA